jgi:hypothetical protein
VALTPAARIAARFNLNGMELQSGGYRSLDDVLPAQFGEYFVGRSFRSAADRFHP